jgi:hypothetical protein
MESVTSHDWQWDTRAVDAESCCSCPSEPVLVLTDDIHKK